MKRALSAMLVLCACASVRVDASGATRVHTLGDVKVETLRCAEPQMGARPDVPATPGSDAEPETRTCVHVEGASGVGVMFQRVVEGVIIARIVAYFLVR